jgi:hypothetical protein
MVKASTDISDLGVTEVKLSNIDLGDTLAAFGLKPRERPSRYIRTIPLPWATKAMSLPGKSAAVAMLIWYLSGISKSKTVTISPTVLKRFGINRYAAHRALAWLEEAKLIRVKRSGNHSPRVTVINENS